jgi:LacI family transcriptional regulator
MALPVTDQDVEMLIDSDLTTICLEVSHPKLNSVVIDNFNGGRMAAEYLIKKGYKRPAYMGEGGEPAYSLHPTEQRFAGYKVLLENKGIKLPENYICLHPYGMEDSIRCAKTLFKQENPPDAVFCSTDFQAIGALQAAKALGLRVPDDIAILGFDNIDMSGYMDISTIDQGLDESGRIAAELLMEQLKEPGRIGRTINLRLKLIERSTA